MDGSDPITIVIYGTGRHCSWQPSTHDLAQARRDYGCGELSSVAARFAEHCNSSGSNMIHGGMFSEEASVSRQDQTGWSRSCHALDPKAVCPSSNQNGKASSTCIDKMIGPGEL